LYLTTIGRAILKSEDGGESWRAVGLQGQIINALEIDPNPNIVYAATPGKRDLQERRLWRKLDASEQWIDLFMSLDI